MIVEAYHKMHEKDDNSIAPMEIDLNAAKSGELDEKMLRQLGFGIEWTLRQMFHDGAPIGNTNVTGTPAQIAAFAAALGNEKNYIDAFNRFGLGDPKTFERKWKLDQSIRRFEMATGLKWPFK
jgi:hypothetical protein